MTSVRGGAGGIFRVGCARGKPPAHHGCDGMAFLTCFQDMSVFRATPRVRRLLLSNMCNVVVAIALALARLFISLEALFFFLLERNMRFVFRIIFLSE
ncbi:hypothetical protein ACXXAA_18145 [Bordetella bronchiseptica]|uniref:hypothetical protein n=1 Tax=Bordetella bronchiseptica TaxID=518 RepID=UPI001F2DDCAE|nr:hypothetical protein [Bordetella bronchiseptica]